RQRDGGVHDEVEDVLRRRGIDTDRRGQLCELRDVLLARGRQLLGADELWHAQLVRARGLLLRLLLLLSGLRLGLLLDGSGRSGSVWGGCCGGCRCWGSRGALRRGDWPVSIERLMALARAVGTHVVHHGVYASLVPNGE